MDETYQKVLTKCERQYKGKPKQINACISGTLYTTMDLTNKKKQMSKCRISGYD